MEKVAAYVWAASLNTNYTIIEFSEIYTMPELEESEMPLDMLFR